MVNRQNKTIRPDVPITEPTLSLEDTHQKLAGSKSTELRLWAELAEDPELSPEGEVVWPSYQVGPNGIIPKSDLIVIFLKWFDIDKQTLAGVGHIYISREKKVEELVPAILKKMQWAEKSFSGERLQLKLFEVHLIPELDSSC
jgi:ubiquitin carboxyl-terminal hydrolase 7